MRCPHCGGNDIPHIAVADVGLTDPKDDDVLTCRRCDGTFSYVEWLKEEIAGGKTRVLMEADATTEATQERIEIELAIHRNKDGNFAYLETVKSGPKVTLP